jgi:redox-sensitive bicupin YhaK (pirin superfamily)
MTTIRRSHERGHANHGWLDSHHSFSFGSYYDPEHMGVSVLRVINDDRVAPGAGFGTHPHRDMEIISYVLDGALEHRDSMGTGSVIRPGDVQRMSAGTGVTHSEFNHSQTDPVHFLQIWVLPEREGLEPGYEQVHVAPDEKRGRLRLVASGTPVEGAVRVHQDVHIYAALLAPREAVEHRPQAGRQLWLQVARGSVEVAGERLAEGDALHLTGGQGLAVTGAGGAEAEILLFDLP